MLAVYSHIPPGTYLLAPSVLILVVQDPGAGHNAGAADSGRDHSLDQLAGLVGLPIAGCLPVNQRQLLCRV